MSSIRARALVPVLVSSLFASILQAAPRTFVASTGTDANPCTRALPCRTFQAAIAAVDADGEIVALDSAGYGPFTIDRSVTVTADGVHAAITVPAGANGVTTAVLASDHVTLRNLSFVGSSTGAGVSNSGPVGALYIENCSFTALAEAIDFEIANTGVLRVTDSTFRGDFDCMFVAGGPGEVNLMVDGSHFEDFVRYAVFAGTLTNGVVSNSVVTGGGTLGSGALTADGTSGVLAVDNCVISGNAFGVQSLTTVRVANSLITANTSGIGGTGSLISVGGNRLTGNGTDGAFTSTVSQR